MQRFAKVVNEETKACIVGIGDPAEHWKVDRIEIEPPSEENPDGVYEEVERTVADYYREQGMELLDVAIADDGKWYLAGFGPVTTLEERKLAAYQTLWENYKGFQTRYVDAEDLTLAVLCASHGSLNGAAVQSWVMGLWQTYYGVKDRIAAAADAAELDAIDLAPDAYGPPPYTIRELNEEAARALRGGETADQ